MVHKFITIKKTLFGHLTFHPSCSVLNDVRMYVRYVLRLNRTRLRHFRFFCLYHTHVICKHQLITGFVLQATCAYLVPCMPAAGYEFYPGCPLPLYNLTAQICQTTQTQIFSEKWAKDLQEILETTIQT